MADQAQPMVLVSLGENLEVWRVRLDDLHEQPKNARTMDPQAFNRLVQNIEKGHRLESLPFCALDNKRRVHIVSGHHRVRAARAAGMVDTPVLVDVTGLSRSQVVAKQLAHNALQGSDDRDLLGQLYQEMTSLDDMLESFIDPKDLNLALGAAAVSLHDIRVAFDVKTVTFTFLPSQLEDFTRAAELVPPDAVLVGVVPLATYDQFQTTLRELGRQCDIRSVGALVTKMCDLTLEWLASRREDDG